MRKMHWHFLACLALSFCPAGVAMADVIPQAAGEARERFTKYENVYDRSDQFCRSKKVGAACEIPGTPFEGGGKGTCKRDLPDRASQIDLRCTPSARVEIERRVPDGPFRRDRYSCEGSKTATGEEAAMDCKDPPPVADRFCAGRKVNDACTAVFTVAGNAQSEAGRCGMTTEEYRYYQYGYRIATRPVILCQPLHPAPAPVFEKAPLAGKLRPW